MKQKNAGQKIKNESEVRNPDAQLRIEIATMSGRTVVWDANVYWHHGVQLRAFPETFRMLRSCGIEGFKWEPQLGT